MVKTLDIETLYPVEMKRLMGKRRCRINAGRLAAVAAGVSACLGTTVSVRVGVCSGYV